MIKQKLDTKNNLPKKWFDDWYATVSVPPLLADRPKFLPTQFMRSSGIDCTKYSRCSFGIVHIGRFFWVISSSRFLRSCSKFGYQTNSHEHTNGLSIVFFFSQGVCVEKNETKMNKQVMWIYVHMETQKDVERNQNSTSVVHKHEQISHVIAIILDYRVFQVYKIVYPQQGFSVQKTIRYYNKVRVIVQSL